MRFAGLKRRRARVQITAVTLSGNSLSRQTVHTHRPSFHQAAKLVAALLRVAGVTGGKYWQPTAGFMTHVTCTLTATNRDQLRNPTLGNRVWATFLRGRHAGVGDCDSRGQVVEGGKCPDAFYGSYLYGGVKNRGLLSSDRRARTSRQISAAYGADI